MAVQPAFEPIVVTPVLDDRCDVWPDVEAERKRRRAEARRGRQATAFDGLAIGAPLSAAFIGMLFADGRIVADARTGQAEDVIAARGDARGVDLGETNRFGAGADARAGTEGRLADTGGSEASASAFAPSAEIGGSSSGAARVPADGEVAIPDEAAAGPAVEADVSAGPEISLSIGGFGLRSGLADEVAAASSDVNSIGRHVVGSDGDDLIVGTEHDDRLFGGAGNDEIHGLAGDDLLDGGLGDDELHGGAGDDRLLGGAGQDQLHGGSGRDFLDGGPGSDGLFGDEGRDILLGGSGNDLLDGGVGADRMQGDAGDDVLRVGDLHDVALENDRGADAGGVDTLEVHDGFASGLLSGFGHESATFVLHDRLDAVLPRDVASHRQQVDPDIEHVVLIGSANHDVVGDDAGNELTGNDGDNALFGMGGDDILSGGLGRDRLDGGSGNDQLRGGSGNDILRGRAGDDELFGGSGDDMIYGGLGADRLVGQAGNDTFHVGINDSAIDTIFDHEGVNAIVIENALGRTVETSLSDGDLHVYVDKNPIAIVEGYVGNEGVLSGIDSGGGITPISDLMAGNAAHEPGSSQPGSEHAGSIWAGDDLLGDFLTGPSVRGGDGVDTLTGTSGSDWLFGLQGDDHLQGAAGRDVLEGGPGSDLLEGGAGDDRYLFRSGDAGLDTIRDVDGSNTVELDGFAGADLEGRVVGRDLLVAADYAPLFVVQDFVGNEGSFAGIQNGDSFVASEDLLT